jgi:hypothetical protein
VDTESSHEKQLQAARDNYDRLLVLWREQSQVIADLGSENKTLRERITQLEERPGR